MWVKDVLPSSRSLCWAKPNEAVPRPHTPFFPSPPAVLAYVQPAGVLLLPRVIYNRIWIRSITSSGGRRKGKKQNSCGSSSRRRNAPETDMLVMATVTATVTVSVTVIVTATVAVTVTDKVAATWLLSAYAVISSSKLSWAELASPRLANEYSMWMAPAATPGVCVTPSKLHSNCNLHNFPGRAYVLVFLVCPRTSFHVSHLGCLSKFSMRTRTTCKSMQVRASPYKL